MPRNVWLILSPERTVMRCGIAAAKFAEAKSREQIYVHVSAFDSRSLRAHPATARGLRVGLEQIDGLVMEQTSRIGRWICEGE
jgi:hypothetical protein